MLPALQLKKPQKDNYCHATPANMRVWDAGIQILTCVGMTKLWELQPAYVSYAGFLNLYAVLQHIVKSCISYKI